MKKIFSDVYKYLRQNKKRYMSLAIFCKVLLLGFLAIPILQTIQTAYAQSTCGNAIIERGENCDDGNTNNNDGCNDTCQLEWFENTDIKNQIKSNLTTQYGALSWGPEKVIVGSCLSYIKHMENDRMGTMIITTDLTSTGVFVDSFPYTYYFLAISNMNIGNTMDAYMAINKILERNEDPAIMDNPGFRNAVYTWHPSIIGGTISGLVPLGTTTYDKGMNDICAPYTAVCGNDIVEADEECDGTNIDGQTCGSLGFAGGTLSCTPSCTFDTANCSPHSGGPVMDNCFPRFGLPGANTGGIDYSLNSFDRTCLAPVDLTCSDLSCLNLQYITDKLAELNDQFGKFLQVTTLPVVKVVEDNKENYNDLIKLLQGFVDRIYNLNDQIINTLK